MDRVGNIRAAEKEYHDSFYEQHSLFEPGTWLSKPVQTVMDLLQEYSDRDELRILDLGAGVGRNSIPMAQSLRDRKGKVVCVDILESAIEKLQEYSQVYGVEDLIEAKRSDIEQFPIELDEYDMIVSVSALEHVSSVSALERKLGEMALGTKQGGANCIIIGTNILEVSLADGQKLDPMFEVNLTTPQMIGLLGQQYAGWDVLKRSVKQLEYEIDRKWTTCEADDGLYYFCC